MEDKTKGIFYDKGQEYKYKPTLPAIFNKPMKKKRKKVDQMILDLEQENMKDQRNQNQILHPALSDMDAITLNPVEIFEKLNLAAQEKTNEVVKKVIDEEQLKKDEEDALWGSDDQKEIVLEEDGNDIFDCNEKTEMRENEDEIQKENDSIKDLEQDFRAIIEQENEEEPESLMIPPKRISSPIKCQTKLIKKSTEPSKVKESGENECICAANPLNNYYKNKEKLLRIFNNKSPKKQSIDTQGEKLENNKKNRNKLSSSCGKTNFTQTPGMRNSANTNLDTNNINFSVEEESKNEEMESKRSTLELFHDFDEKDLENYDIEEVRECLELEKLNKTKANEENDQGFSLFSEEMYSDIKNLLVLFGIPYIDAPFEAESQCAYLEMIGKVDGVVTQDSDVFLFGSRNVYKDIFEQNKFVEYYNMGIIESELGFDRHSLVAISLLLGSDYTVGVKGIGPVNGTECVQTFYDLKGLKRFKEWTDKGSFQDKKEMEIEVREYHKNRSDNVSKAQKTEEILNEIEYKKKHLEMIKHWEFPSGFPSRDVAEGFLEPYIGKLI